MQLSPHTRLIRYYILSHFRIFSTASHRAIKYRREKNASLRTGQDERANKLRDYLGSLVKGDSPRCGEMSKGSLEKGDSPRCGEMSKGSLEKGDSPRCGEMSRSDKGDGLPSGAGREFASGLRDYSGSLVKGAVIEDD